MNKKTIGDLFVVGYQGLEPSDDFLRFVETWGIGGVIVFARNIAQPDDVARAISRIQEAAGKKIFAAIDQEGGLVMRLLQGCSLFQSAMGLAATNDQSLIENSYAAMAKEMLALGLNWNLAPVLDINHPDNPGIGARSFGDAPESVADFGCAAIRGLQSCGVLACAKHFPGKGKARVDSHLTLPIIDSSRSDLERNELLPFKKAISARVAAIMTAHVFFPAFEQAQDLPATLSRSVLTGLLRDELKFQGLLITDDLEMGAITEKYGIAEAASRSFFAGADLLLICHSLDQQIAAAERILNMSREKPEYAQRLEESLLRIEKARTALPDSSAHKLQDLVVSHQPMIETCHEKSLRFLNFQTEMLNLDENEDLLFVFPQISALVQVEEEHNQTGIESLFKTYFKSARMIEFNPKDPAEKIVAAVQHDTRRDEKLVFFSYNAHLFQGQTDAAKSLAKTFPASALIALRNPYDLKFLPEFKTRGASFSFRTPALVAILKTLKGTLAPQTAPWPIDVRGW